MNYKSLLMELDIFEENFTSTAISQHLKRPLKEVSNDLRRLHQMRFLRRRRRRRLCLSKTGTSCYKGYEYLYSFSKQGRGYVKWMREQKPIEDLAHINLNKEIIEHLPPHLVNKIISLVTARSFYKYKGPNRQFHLFDNAGFIIANALFENSQLAQENFILSVQNLKLLLEKIDLKSSVDSLRQFNVFFMDVIRDAWKTKDQLEKDSGENVIFLLEYIGKFLALQDIPEKVIKIYRKTQIVMVFALYLFLPKEKFTQIMEMIAQLTEKDRTELNKKIEELTSTIKF